MVMRGEENAEELKGKREKKTNGNEEGGKNLEVLEEEETDLNPKGPRKHLCRLCGRPKKIGSQQVQPGVRGCICHDPCPYYSLPRGEEFVYQFIHGSHPPASQRAANILIPPYVKKLCLPPHPMSVGEKSSEKPPPPKLCPIEPIEPIEPMESPKLHKERSFVPPQGMDAGQCPKALFYQYYPNDTAGYTFDILPLAFLDRLKYQNMRELSMDDKNIYDKWKNFLDGLPESEIETIPTVNKRFWRWKLYRRYLPNENPTYFRKLMEAGPKLDRAGRLPICGEDLPTFREYRNAILRPTDVKNILRKGDGQKRVISRPNIRSRTSNL